MEKQSPGSDVRGPKSQEQWRVVSDEWQVKNGPRSEADRGGVSGGGEKGESVVRCPGSDVSRAVASGSLRVASGEVRRQRKGGAPIDRGGVSSGGVFTPPWGNS